MQFQVPQFIETEDKIVGPFTIRQFIYVGIAGGLSAMLYFTVQFAVWAILSVFIFGGAVALAFVKVEGRPLFNVVNSALGFYWKPQTYLWKPQHAEAAPAATPTKQESGVSLENILTGMALHKRWENLQTGEKLPSGNIVEHTMAGRYEIFKKITGDRRAAKRIDYR
jgi:hypothetical protein